MRERLVNGLLKENPTFVLMLGMCPTLAVTTSAINGMGMGAHKEMNTCCCTLQATYMPLPAFSSASTD